VPARTVRRSARWLSTEFAPIFNAILAVNVASLFLAFTTGSTLMIWVFALAFIGFIGYCYMLAQIRQQQMSRRYARPYYRAA